MRLIRLQDMTPSVYTEESRDFQLFLRLCDCLYNGVKFDIDSMLNILDSEMIKTDLLSLLQTKLGFFTDVKMNDTALRYILRVFPILVKNKGSKLAIEQLINTYLKIYNITSTVSVTCVNGGMMYRGIEIDDHSIIIELSNAMNSTSILTEVFRYILPTGYGFYLYFYDTVADMNTFNLETNAEVLFISDNLESEVRGNFAKLENNTWTYNDPHIAVDLENRLVGAIDLFEVSSGDNFTPTNHGTYEVGDISKFRGIVTDLTTITNPRAGDVAIVRPDYYVYSDNDWNKMSFKGIKKELPVTGRHNYDVVGINSKKYMYYYDSQSNWTAVKYRGTYDSLENVPTPAKNDCVEIEAIDPTTHQLTSTYYLYLNAAWRVLNYRYYYRSLRDIEDPVLNDLVIVNGVTYYMYKNGWQDYTYAIYLLLSKTIEDEEEDN